MRGTVFYYSRVNVLYQRQTKKDYAIVSDKDCRWRKKKILANNKKKNHSVTETKPLLMKYVFRHM